MPQLRNVALTPPYFHNGGFSNLHQVVEFYRRGGNRRDAADGGATGDNSGTGLGRASGRGPDRGSNAAGTLNPLTITDPNIDDIVEFLKALTDVRVQCDRAPFDHPELLIPVGHKPVDQNHDSRADDIVFRLPEIGASGYSPGSGLCVPNAGDLFARHAGAHRRTAGPGALKPVRRRVRR